MQKLLDELDQKRQTLRLGGGIERIKKLKDKGKLTAWERVERLIDQGSEYIEIGQFAGEDLYLSEGGAPNGGVVVIMGRVKGRLCVIVSNDPTVKSGAWFPITGKKNLRAQEIAMENRIAIIYLVDSAGVYLPMQDEIFPDKEHFGRIFRNNAKLSAMGVPQIAAILGNCVAGGAYLPIMSDYALIVKGTGSVYLAGSYLVKSAIGEVVDSETLGGAKTHTEISGVTDNQYDTEEDCLDAIRNIVDKFGSSNTAGFNRGEIKIPSKSIGSLSEVFPTDRTKPYDMYAVLDRVLDEGSFEEYKKDYGRTIICGLARIDGWAVGIIANQRKIVKALRPGNKTEIQTGGVIYSDSADKAARFIMNCNQQKIPLVFFQDVSGFIVGSRAEQGGIIKDGAKLVNVMSNSVVPKFTFIIGNSYGAGNYAMCGKAFDPRLIYSWPTAQLAVMSGASAGNTLLQIQEAALRSKSQLLSEAEKKRILDDINAKYNAQLSPYYAAARLWTDGIIRPDETRKIISMGIEAANQNSEIQDFKTGVLQT